MARFKCEICGAEHAQLPRDLGYDYPADCFKILPAERPTRVKYNEDLCLIDDVEFYARGVLALPIRETEEEFRWGVWARIDHPAYERYLSLWSADEAAHEPPFPGILSGGIGAYPESDLRRYVSNFWSANGRGSTSCQKRTR